MKTNQKIISILVGTAIALWGMALLLFNVGNPPLLHFDMAQNAMDAIAANSTGNYQLFYPANFGREGLFINLIALSFKLFGIGIIQYRAVGIFIMLLTELIFFLIAKELFRKKATVYLTLLLFVSSGWVVAIGRLGLRASIVPLAVGLMYLGYLKLDRSHWNAIASMCLALLGFSMLINSYPGAWPFIPLWLFFLWKLSREKKNSKSYNIFYVANVVVLGVFGWLVISGTYSIARMGEVVTNETMAPPLWIHLAKPLAIISNIFIAGSLEPHLNAYGFPLLPLLALFLIYEFIFLNKNKKPSQVWYMLVWICLGTVTSLISTIGLNYLRTTVIMLPLFLLLGFAIDWLLSNKTLLAGKRKPLVMLFIILLVLSGAIGGPYYHYINITRAYDIAAQTYWVRQGNLEKVLPPENWKIAVVFVNMNNLDPFNAFITWNRYPNPTNGKAFNFSKNISELEVPLSNYDSDVIYITGQAIGTKDSVYETQTPLEMYYQMGSTMPNYVVFSYKLKGYNDTILVKRTKLRDLQKLFENRD